MELDTSKDPKNLDLTPSLEELIITIDRQIDQVPSLSAAEGLAAFLGTGAEDYQRKAEQCVRFFLSSTAFALPLQNTLGIDYIPAVIPLPNLPRWVLGICNLHGDIVSVVDIKQILHLMPGGTHTAGKLILIRNNGVRTAIIVDNIGGMLSVYNHDQKKPPENTVFSKYVKETLISGRQTIHLLDLDVLMAAIKIQASFQA
jgi:purine-binding chemotaxis protein CheW